MCCCFATIVCWRTLSVTFSPSWRSTMNLPMTLAWSLRGAMGLAAEAARRYSSWGELSLRGRIGKKVSPM